MMVSPAQHDCRLRWRELLPQAGILDVSSSSVHLDIEIFQYYDTMEGSVLYITTTVMIVMLWVERSQRVIKYALNLH